MIAVRSSGPGGGQASAMLTNEAGEVTLTFGKHSGKTVQAIFAEDQEYLRWIYEKAEMPSDTKMIAQRIYSKLSSMKKDA